jgi:ABC-type molybdate transport system ATPase subunit
MAGSCISIERKGLGDAWGTLTGGLERFEREIKRAFNSGAYLVILVECPFSDLEVFPNLRRVYGKIKIPVEFVYHSIRDLSQKYQHIQFLFVKDRDEASRVIKKLFAADEQVKNVDLQLLYDTGNL